MSITLKQLCSDTETKYNLKLIAGKNGMTNTVRWVHMVEDRQVPDFLHGGELVFTTGIGHIGKDPLLAFVKRLINHGASGVVVNIGPYLASVPQEVIDYCNEENFPLFTLPWSVYIIDITYDFCRRIIENEKIETTAAEAFKSIILSPEQGKKYYSFLEQHGFGKDAGYRVFTLNLYKDGKNITEEFERSNHIKLWSILAKSKDYPSAMFVLENTAVVVRQDTSRRFIKNITDTLDAVSEQKNIAYTMGISTQRNGYKSAAKLLSEADAARKTAVSENKSFEYYSEIGVNKILFGVKDKTVLKEFAAKQLDEIIAYDNEYKTDYAKILYEYIMCDGSVIAVADNYGIHRNTVNTKIKNIKSIFNIELTGEKKTELLLAFKIKKLLNENGGI